MTETVVVEHRLPLPAYLRELYGDPLRQAAKAWIRDGLPMGFAPSQEEAPADTYVLDWWTGLGPLIAAIVTGVTALLAGITGLGVEQAFGASQAVTAAATILRYGLPAHEAAHTGSFGSQFQPLKDEGYGPDGGLNHVPTSTFDVMTPHGPRLRDSRGIVQAYRDAKQAGRIKIKRT